MSGELLPYAPVVLKLLQDVMYYDDRHWTMLLNHEVPVKNHFASIGLLLHVDEAEGYAYLTQPDAESESDSSDPLPRLVRRTPLTREATLLSVFLREALQQWDAHGQDRLVLPKDRLHEMLLPFYSEQANMVRLGDKIDGVIKQVVKVGFLRKLNIPGEEAYEVRRIIKAKITADKLVEIRDQLLARVEISGE